MRCAALSSTRVLDVIREFYIPYALNVTRDGPDFPAAQHLPALAHVKAVYATNWRYEFGFASCLMLTPDGQHPLGVVGGTASEADFLETMVKALERNQQLERDKAKLARGDRAGWVEVRALVAEVAQDLRTRHAAMVAQQRRDLAALH